MLCTAELNHRGLLMIGDSVQPLPPSHQKADREDCGSHGRCHRALCGSAAAAVVAVMHLIGRAQDLSPTILP